MKILIPYYKGDPRIERAIKTWPSSDVVLGIVDKGIAVDDSYDRVHSDRTSASVGVGRNNKPFLVDLMIKMVEKYPNEKYYGYFNSDIILPPHVSVAQLIPSAENNIVFHHRMDVTEELEAKFQVYVGKDGFIARADTIKDIIDIFKSADFILGAPCWDDGLALWCWKNYGNDNVELRYGSVLHTIHPQRWDINNLEGMYNRKHLTKMNVLDEERFRIDWRHIYLNKGKLPPLDNRKTLGIIQPGRRGDIVIVLPIAKWFYDRGYDIVWPVVSEYLPLFGSYVPYVEAVGLDVPIEQAYLASRNYLIKRRVSKILNLGIGFGRDEEDWISSGLSFDSWKYHISEVPESERFNLQIVRDKKKESSLINRLGLAGKKYSFSHSKGFRGAVDFQVSTLEFKIFPEYTIWDWIGVIEGAKHVYCVDSCMSHVVNQLNLAKGRRTFRAKDRQYYGKELEISNINWENDFIKERQPIHFFTIVLNGMPFIKYHIDMMTKLPYKWHWHIVEGPAKLVHDTGWSVKNGGTITDIFHKKGRSIDGTSEYLDELAKKYSDNVTIYRTDGRLWEGKIEMINSFIDNLPDSCVLWQIDSDELWTVDNIERTINLLDKTGKMGAFVYCYYFVGPTKYITTMDGWATSSEDWLRVFRYRRGFKWSKHEPPILVDESGKDVIRSNVLTREDTMRANISFQHFAYSIVEQVEFKEVYYGYKDAVSEWKKLQKAKCPVDITKYISWSKRNDRPAIAEEWSDKEELLWVL